MSKFENSRVTFLNTVKTKTTNQNIHSVSIKRNIHLYWSMFWLELGKIICICKKNIHHLCIYIMELHSFIYVPPRSKIGGISFLSFVHNSMLISFEQWELELWYFTWAFLVIGPFWEYQPCDLDIGNWLIFWKFWPY